jgi:predicted DNA-binding protein with PD1-like motif
MRFSEARQGRVFVLRLEDGDILHECVERFAREHQVRTAAVIALGGADGGSRLVVGPESDRGTPVVPAELALSAMHEATGTGTLLPDAHGQPHLHMHMAFGRREETKVGCTHRGVRIWHVMEVVVFELVGSSAHRELDPVTGLELMVP